MNKDMVEWLKQHKKLQKLLALKKKEKESQKLVAHKSNFKITKETRKKLLTNKMDIIVETDFEKESNNEEEITTRTKNEDECTIPVESPIKNKIPVASIPLVKQDEIDKKFKRKNWRMKNLKNEKLKKKKIEKKVKDVSIEKPMFLCFEPLNSDYINHLTLNFD